MLYHVRMDVSLPADMPEAEANKLKADERDYAQRLQREGKWVELWRVVGEYANYSIFDVDSHDELHAMLSGLPLFPYLQIKVTPLTRHPSKVDV